MMVSSCNGSLSSLNQYHCNGTVAGCPSLLEEEDYDQEFLMDTEEHRRILGDQAGKRTIVYPAIRDPSSAVPPVKVGLYLGPNKGRICVFTCDRG